MTINEMRLEGGRTFYSGGSELFYIAKGDKSHLAPVEVDAMAHLINELLNKYGVQGINDYINGYMRI